MNSYIGLRDRIKGYLATGDPTETITLIEDELEEIFDCIVEEIGDDYFMCGNGVISGFTKRGYIITSDSGQRMLASFAAFKGDKVSKGDRVQYNAAYLYEDRNICLDFMKCMTLEDLKYHMFSCIENCLLPTSTQSFSASLTASRVSSRRSYRKSLTNRD